MFSKLVKLLSAAATLLIVVGNAAATTVGPADPATEPNGGMIGSAPVYDLFDTSDPPLVVSTTSFIAQSVAIDSGPAALRTLTFSALMSEPDTLYVLVNGIQVKEYSERRVSDWSWYSFDLSSLPVVASQRVSLEFRNSISSPVAVVLVPWIESATYRRIDVLNGAIIRDVTEIQVGSVNFQLEYDALPVPEQSVWLMLSIGTVIVSFRRHSY